MIHVSLCHLQWSQCSRYILNIPLCISMPFCQCLRYSTSLCFSSWIHRIFCLLSCMILSSFISIAIISVLWTLFTIVHYITDFDSVCHGSLLSPHEQKSSSFWKSLSAKGQENKFLCRQSSHRFSHIHSQMCVCHGSLLSLYGVGSGIHASMSVSSYTTSPHSSSLLYQHFPLTLRFGISGLP